MADVNMIPLFALHGIAGIGSVLTNKRNRRAVMPKHRILTNVTMAVASTHAHLTTMSIPIMDMPNLNWLRTVSKGVFLIMESDAYCTKGNGHVT